MGGSLSMVRIAHRSGEALGRNERSGTNSLMTMSALRNAPVMAPAMAPDRMTGTASCATRRVASQPKARNVSTSDIWPSEMTPLTSGRSPNTGTMPTRHR